jgi:multicomponent K+:H+ antiporter subunit G
MHAPTKATTLGVGLILVASSLATWLAQREISLHEVLVALLLFVSAPVSAYMIARVALQQDPRAREGADRPDR